MDKNLKKLGEYGLIDRLISHLPELPKHRWMVGIGDDTSVLRLGEHHYQLLSHDLLLEGIHFVVDRPKDFYDLGWKALAVNLSDIAAMGGVPQEAVVGLGIPDKAKLRETEELYRGLGDCSREYHCKVVGGDTNRSKSGWVIAVAVTGFSPRLPKFRSGARPGDTLWVSGSLGGAALGWRARRKKMRSAAAKPFLQKFQRPEPRVMWGQRLAERAEVTAMIDVSDGLAGDLDHLMTAGEVGFEVNLEKIPRIEGFEALCKKLKAKPLDLLLGGGEDYELLFTVRGVSETEFSRWLREKDICAGMIGRAVREKQVRWLQENRRIHPAVRGFRHF